jgi:nucleoside-diphosphate-sugar epimerase
MRNAEDVVRIDLEHICGNLVEEFSAMSGKNLLITGGAGFLGHYLVQAVLHWNAVSGETPIRLTVYDNFVRGVPPWLERLKGDRNLVLVKHDVTDPLPKDMGDFDLSSTRPLASPTYYRGTAQTMDANVNG